jgi:hypothetical protein
MNTGTISGTLRAGRVTRAGEVRDVLQHVPEAIDAHGRCVGLDGHRRELHADDVDAAIGEALHPRDVIRQQIGLHVNGLDAALARGFDDRKQQSRSPADPPPRRS